MPRLTVNDLITDDPSFWRRLRQGRKLTKEEYETVKKVLLAAKRAEEKVAKKEAAEAKRVDKARAAHEAKLDLVLNNITKQVPESKFRVERRQRISHYQFASVVDEILFRNEYELGDVDNSEGILDYASRMMFRITNAINEITRKKGACKFTIAIECAMIRDNDAELSQFVF